MEDNTIFSGFRPLLASYGGGHAQIIAAVAEGLIAGGAEVDLFGFTTARAAFERRGLSCKSVIALLEPEDEAYLERVESLLPASGHPDITPEETHAYFAIGLKGLVEQLGESAAIEKTKAEGRKAFLPVSVFTRYIAKTAPDMVIATTSPRFELALLRAARAAGITSLAIGDLFLKAESSWIQRPDYAEHLFVLNEHVRQLLLSSGAISTQIHITGNPVFDRLHNRSKCNKLRNSLRQQTGDGNNRVILWPAASAAMSMIGRPFEPIENVVAFLTDYCTSRPGTNYLIRPHPNTPLDNLNLPPFGGLTPPEWSIEDCILAADHVLVEASTVGLQAALTGIPVTCVGFGDYVDYPHLGLGDAVPTLADATKSLDNYIGPDMSINGIPAPGQSLQMVIRKIDKLRQVK